MRKIEIYMGSFIWVATATLLPLAALESVSGPSAEPAAAFAFASCADGSAHLAMGCTASSL